jgi:hypothetical protein
MLLLTRARWPQPIALQHWGQGRIDPNISRIQFYPPSGKQRFLLAKPGTRYRIFHPPPTRYSLLLHRAAAKIGHVTRIHTAFWAWRLHWTKKFIKGFRKSLDMAFLPFLKFKNIFIINKVTALSKSVKPGKWKKTYFLRRVITWSKIVQF